MTTATAHDIDYMRGAIIAAHLPYTPRRSVETTRYTDEVWRDRASADPYRQRCREMQRASTRLSSTETRPKKKSSMPLPPWAFEHTRLIRAIGRLEPLQQHWLRYAYADSREWDDESGVTLRLWEAFEPTLTRAQAKTLKRAKGLAHLAVQDHKARVNRGRPIHEPAGLQALLGVNQSNWDQHWCGRWQSMHRLLDEIDRAALEALWGLTENEGSDT